MNGLVFKSAAGRKPVDRNVVLNPHAKMIVVCGATEIGKTFQTKKEIREFVHVKSLPAIICDINGDDYPEYKISLPGNAIALSQPQIRRVVPFGTDGVEMDDEQKKDMLYYLLKNFRNGLLVLDDIDKYATGLRGQKITGALTTYRHSGFDLMIIHQSLGKVTTTEWENIKLLRLHHQTDEIERLADKKIADMKLLKISQLIVDNVYYSAIRLYKDNKISFKNFVQLRSYYVYVNFTEHKIYNCEWNQFEKAMKQFLNLNQKLISNRMLIGDDDGKKITREQAIKELITQYSEYFGE